VRYVENMLFTCYLLHVINTTIRPFRSCTPVDRGSTTEAEPVPSVVIYLCSVVGTNIKRSIKGKITTEGLGKTNFFSPTSHGGLLKRVRLSQSFEDVV
jgi:hypothetical protein